MQTEFTFQDPRKKIGLTTKNNLYSNKHNMNAELIDQLLKAICIGDSTLESFPDSLEKTSILETIASWKSQMSQKELTTQKLQEIKRDLDTAKNEEEQFIIMLNVLDNYELTTPEAKEFLKDYSDLLRRIRKVNKA